MRGSSENIADVEALPDNRMLIMGVAGGRFQLVDRAGKIHVRWKRPVWLGELGSTSSSPDGKAVAIVGADPPSDSVVVGRVDIASGAFTKLASVNAEWFGTIKWTSDGKLLFDVRESSGSTALYSMLPDGSAMRRTRSLPRSTASYTISADGKRFAAFAPDDRRDVFMIRNLADILRR